MQRLLKPSRRSFLSGAAATLAASPAVAWRKGGVPYTLPPGASGVWFMNQYSGGQVPNFISGGPPLVINAAAGFSGGILDMSAANGTNWGTITWPDTFDVSQPYTVVCAEQRFNLGGGDNPFGTGEIYPPWLSDKDNNNWWVSHGGGVVTETPFGMISNNPGGPTLFDQVGNGFGVFTFRYTGTEADQWFDNTRMLLPFPQPGVIGSIVVGDMYFNRVYNYTSGLKYAALAFYRRALTDAEITQIVSYIKGRAGISSSPERRLVCAGDSIEKGQGAADNRGYVTRYAGFMNPRLRGCSFAVGGTGIDDIPVNDILAIRAATPSNQKVIVHVMTGTNEIVNEMSAATFLGKYDTLWNTLNAAGCTCVGATLLDRMAVLGNLTQAQFRAQRVLYNNGIRARIGTKIVACTDFAANPIMGVDGAPANPVLFADLVHPTSFGYDLLEANDFRSVINAV